MSDQQLHNIQKLFVAVTQSQPAWHYLTKHNDNDPVAALNLLSCCKSSAQARKYFYDNFCELRINHANFAQFLAPESDNKKLLKPNTKTQLEPRRVFIAETCTKRLFTENIDHWTHLRLPWYTRVTVPADLLFGNLVRFECPQFNESVSDFGPNLRVFVSDAFNQTVRNFGRLRTFSAYHFNKPIENFGCLSVFIAHDFNQKINSFDNLQYFRCFCFNRPIQCFGKLRVFSSEWFNQVAPPFANLRVFRAAAFNQVLPAGGFGRLEFFVCAAFRQKVTHFGPYLKVFISAVFNWPVEDFGTLKYFKSHQFDHPVRDFGQLRDFVCIKFNQPVQTFGSLKAFESYAFNHPIQTFDQLLLFCCHAFDQKVDNYGNLKYFCGIQSAQTTLCDEEYYRKWSNNRNKQCFANFNDYLL